MRLRSLVLFSSMICSVLWCWTLLETSSHLGPTTAENHDDALNEASDPRGVNVTVHGIQHSYNLLINDELKHWGQYTYEPNHIMCAVPTTWNHSAHRIRRIQKTWGPLCDILVFAVASEYDIPTNVTVGELLVVNMTRSASPKAGNIWEKTHLMWTAVADMYIDKADWFVKVDDDTFLFVNHLKKFTQYYNPKIPRYFGHTILNYWKSLNIVFNAGLAYVLSREALERVAVKLRNLPTWKDGMPYDACQDREAAPEDATMAICLHSVGINADNTLDAQGRQRFLPFHRTTDISAKKMSRGFGNISQ